MRRRRCCCFDYRSGSRPCVRGYRPQVTQLQPGCAKMGAMPVDPRAGKLATPDMLVNVPRLITAYYAEQPDVSEPHSESRSAPRAIAVRRSRPRSTRTISSRSRRRSASTASAGHRPVRCFSPRTPTRCREPALASALEVLAANGVEVMVDTELGYTPTPALSHAILTYNRGRKSGLADGIVITPSHNPPDDGGFKYNPPNGGPADTTRDQVDRGPRQRHPGGRPARRAARPIQRALDRHNTHATIISRRTSTIWARHRHRCHPRRASDARRRSAGRRAASPTGDASPSATG